MARGDLFYEFMFVLCIHGVEDGLCIYGRHSLSCIALSATLDIPITTMIHSSDCIAGLALIRSTVVAVRT